MSATAFARTTAAVQASLLADPPVAPMVEIARMRALTDKDWAAVVIRPGAAQSEFPVGAGTPIVWRSSFALECYARGTTSHPVSEQVDELLGSVVHRLMYEPTLGGLVASISPDSISWEFDIDGSQTACATVIFSVQHATAPNNLN